ncbi:succinate dehydrogenase cytochrome b558 subunit [Weizmannia acidilactici]|uniref:Succinate dehydrogenase cytochrome b558 subunit n=1 Tax=Weizmannia acidilactici TaxID=2607726 RepID=A0A5J4JIG1_9BACI|nr:succinate dehydrogenase cytochrome b558 subunit [Weizmannia acidilactici]GER67061.1 succinate dehydrogenase cytochrome b558 subunit [Weizmannia acidilactici]GER70217.1 succinate dehydrogenase cytochrome b558 subunit [Weizmannia acidilactici]GER73223.1 succinate dehydrogenase cytochrome b558 subunit [Weizmannia acidilactici]
MAGNREFYHRKLHSLLGVFPIGLFLVIHLTVNHYAVDGAASFNKAANFMEHLPYLLFLEVVLIYLPLLFHAIYGLYIAFTASSNVGRLGYFRNWMYLMQRISGVLVLIFLVFHIYETRIQMALGKPLNFDLMANLLSNPWMLAWYIIGTVAAIFHFSNGLWSFLVSWGITQSQRSQQISTYVMVVVFVLLSIVDVRALLAFA